MKRSRNARGIALVWTAIMLFVMIGIVGLAIDWGWATLDAHKLQNAGDAGALGGAMLVKNAYHDGTLPTVYYAAQKVTKENRAANQIVDVHFDAAGNNPDLDVVVGRWFMADQYFEPLVFGSGDVPNAVKVVTRHVTDWPVNQPLALHFGPVFGVQTANVRREAIAISTGGGGAALVCLAPDKEGFQINGGGKVYVNDGPVPGEIWVDSFLRGSPHAVHPNANGAPDPAKGWWIDCEGLYTCGTVDPSIMEYFGGAPNFLFSVWEKLPSPIPDPLSWVPALDVPSMNPRNETPPNPYGMVVKIDPTTGGPMIDPTTGEYIPATMGPTGPMFDVSAANPITSSTVRDFGQMIGGRRTLMVTPGYYPGGITQTSSGTNNNTIKMLPGVYAVGGGSSNGDKSGLILNGGALDAQKVMVYVTNSNLAGTGNWGRVDISGQYEYIHLTEYEYLDTDPSYYQNYDYVNYGKAGMAIFQDRRNPMDAKIIGGADNMEMAGTLYFHCTGQQAGVVDAPANSIPDGPWDVTLEVGGSTGQTGIQMIVDRLLVHGDADVIVKYDGRNFQPSIQALIVK